MDAKITNINVISFLFLVWKGIKVDYRVFKWWEATSPCYLNAIAMYLSIRQILKCRKVSTEFHFQPFSPSFKHFSGRIFISDFSVSLLDQRQHVLVPVVVPAQSAALPEVGPERGQFPVVCGEVR